MPTPEEPTFTERAKAHIDLSNTQSHKAPADQVAMSMLYAAARYCAHLCIRGNASGVEMFERRDEAAKIFDAQFHQMFLDCYDEYARRFDRNS